jgi:GT2 family glycosyltransferase
LRGEDAPQRQHDSGVDHRAHTAPEAISLPCHDTPVVSVIIPTYGQLGFTLRCLASIQAHIPIVPIEVLLIDDAFPGPETAALTRINGIRLLRNKVNLGFLRTCNAAAQSARGGFLLFLNNDTEVLPGWLDRMVEVFERWPDTGIVGSRLLGEDGRLREAGGILWKDGSAWNYGQGGDPEAPEFSYLREVDYCSGASLLVRRGVFAQVGGFDEKYAPAYCEDSDLSFRLRRLGLRTIYQPRSEIVHFEGASHGRDIRHGIKACQARNQVTFLETWHDVLAQDHYINAMHVMRARDRAHHRQIVLVIDHYVSEPDRDAGSRTMMTFIRALLGAGLVVKFWPLNLYRSPGYTEALQDIGVEVLYGPHHVSLPDWLKVNGGDVDIVLLSRPDVAEACLPMLRAGTGARIAYYGHDLHFLRLEAQATLNGGAGQRRAARIMRDLEAGIWRDVDLVLYPSEEEAAIVRGSAPSVTVRAVTPYGFAESGSVDPTGFETDAGAEWILFVAGFGHPPNAEAAVWFVNEVLPSILTRVPTARLAIVGSKPPAEVARLSGPRVSLFANVADAALREWYRRARVAVVPLLAGAGVKLKTVEALWYGVPAVVTPAGAQGLPGIEQFVAVRTDAAGFAAAGGDLLPDNLLWRRRSVAQMEYARRHFSEAAQARSLLDALATVGLRPARPPSEPRETAPPADDCVSKLAVA